MTNTFEVEVRTDIGQTWPYVVTGDGLTLKQACDAALHDTRRFVNKEGLAPRVVSVKEISATVIVAEPGRGTAGRGTE